MEGRREDITQKVKLDLDLKNMQKIRSDPYIANLIYYFLLKQNPIEPW